MTPFGPSEEKSLLRSIRSAVDLVSAGSSPDEALAKVAADEQLHPDTVPLLVSAYNVGQQTHRREKCADEGSGTSCLVESYPIARLENVQAKLYPTKKEAAASEQALLDQRVDDVYSWQPTPLRAYEEVKLAELRAAKLPTKMPPRRQAGEFLVADVYNLKSAADKAAYQLDNALRESHEAVLHRLDDVCRYFKQSSDRRISLAEAEFNCRSLFGSDVEGIFDVVSVRSKEARAEGIVRTTRPVNPQEAPYSLVKAAITKVREYVDEERLVTRTKTKIASEVAKADPFAVPLRVNPLLESPPDFSPSQLKEAGFLSQFASTTAGMGAVMRTMPNVKPTSELVDDAAEQLNDPSHIAEMRKAQVRAMLADLAANDDVIKGYDPSEITDSYNEITQLSPNLATQPAAVRGLLRRRLTGGVLEPHDAQQLSDIEKNPRPFGQSSKPADK